jgi:hypothetical protein
LISSFISFMYQKLILIGLPCFICFCSNCILVDCFEPNFFPFSNQI